MHPLNNVAGFCQVGLHVSFPPDAASAPHRHGGASVSAVILKGKAFNKMNDSSTSLLSAGETFYEAPGCHHRISANASETDEMELLATLVVETKVVEEEGMKGLVIVDKGFENLVPHM